MCLLLSIQIEHYPIFFVENFEKKLQSPEGSTKIVKMRFRNAKLKYQALEGQWNKFVYYSPLNLLKTYQKEQPLQNKKE